MIKVSINKIRHDLTQTKDPIRIAILKELLNIKIYEEANKKTLTPGQKKIMSIYAEQKHSLDVLEEMNKEKAYEELMRENEEESQQKDEKKLLEKKRGKMEKAWGGGKIDPKYAKYVESDAVNNKMMERLNSEIEFTMNDG
jgi:hypothetical protein